MTGFPNQQIVTNDDVAPLRSLVEELKPDVHTSELISNIVARAPDLRLPTAPRNELELIEALYNTFAWDAELCTRTFPTAREAYQAGSSLALAIAERTPF